MSQPAKIEDLLTPISGANSCGEDISLAPEWETINNARRKDKITGKRNAEWSDIRSLLETVLETKSKDLRVAVWLMEANTAIEGFGGIHRSLRLLGALLTQFWNGLYPEAEGGDLYYLVKPLEWLSAKEGFPLLIKQIPVTKRSDNGRDFSFLEYAQSGELGWEKDLVNASGDFDEQKAARRKTAMSRGAVSPEMFDQAVAKTRRKAFEIIYADFETSRTALQEFSELLDEKFKQNAPGLSETRDSFEECSRLLGGILERKRKEEPDPVTTDAGPSAGPVKAVTKSLITAHVTVDSQEDGGSWSHAEQLIRDGNEAEGLAAMMRLSAGLASRSQFLHRVRLAEICLDMDRRRTAVAILEELARIIEEQNLDKWESGELLGRVWGRLHQLYRASEPDSEQSKKGTAYLDRLCKLDPWQAIRWDS